MRASGYKLIDKPSDTYFMSLSIMTRGTLKQRIPSTDFTKVDFGFNSSEFESEREIIPIAQFLNPVRTSNWGIAIKINLATAANFNADDSWKIVKHQFSDGKNETLLLCQSPRLVVLHRSGALMSKDEEIIKYDASKQGTAWKSFSYAIVFFLDKNNQPLSQIPLRLKCVGQAGISFIKHYNHYNNSQSFTQKFFQVYQELTGDCTPKNQVFFSHAVYVPNLVKGLAKSRSSELCSPACLTEGFLEPTTDNFTSLIIKNGSPVSTQIKQARADTEHWISLEHLNEEIQSLLTENFNANEKLDAIPY